MKNKFMTLVTLLIMFASLGFNHNAEASANKNFFDIYPNAKCAPSIITIDDATVFYDITPSKAFGLNVALNKFVFYKDDPGYVHSMEFEDKTLDGAINLLKILQDKYGNGLSVAAVENEDTLLVAHMWVSEKESMYYYYEIIKATGQKSLHFDIIYK